jgi:urease accessory protein
MTMHRVRPPDRRRASARPRHPAGPAPLTATALLHLLRLASPALPVGGFSYSEALEAAVEAGRVPDEAAAGRWLLDQLHLVQARADLPVAAAAFKAWSRHDIVHVAELNGWTLRTRESSEMRLQCEQTGRSLAHWLRLEHADEPRVAALAALAPAPAWPVAFALAACLGGAPLREGLLALAFGWAENMVQAALKAVPLGQSAGQRMLAALARDIPPAVDQALSLPDSRRQAFAPMLAILSAQHETQYSRLFRS